MFRKGVQLMQGLSRMMNVIALNDRQYWLMTSQTFILENMRE
jgi:hypothetical protein